MIVLLYMHQSEPLKRKYSKVIATEKKKLQPFRFFRLLFMPPINNLRYTPSTYEQTPLNPTNLRKKNPNSGNLKNLSKPELNMNNLICLEKLHPKSISK